MNLEVRDYLLKYALKLVNRNYDLAEDLVSKTILRYYSNLDKFGNKSSIKTFLVAILKNIYIDDLRALNAKKRGYNPKLFSEINLIDDLFKNYSFCDFTENIDNKVIFDVILKDINSSLKSEKKYDIIMELWLNGYSLKEIADELGENQSTIRVRFRRIKQILNDKIKERYGDLYV